MGGSSRKKRSAAAEGPTKKSIIREVARAMGKSRFTPADISEIRGRIAAQTSSGGSVSTDYIASVLKEAGFRVEWSARPEIQARYEEEFEELLHFADLEEAEMCLVRIDELTRKFEISAERALAERVREIARLGRRRADMIARNQKVDAAKREEKAEIARWFAIWLETPDVFFDWLEVRKQSTEFQQRFGKPSENDPI